MSLQAVLTNVTRDWLQWNSNTRPMKLCVLKYNTVVLLKVQHYDWKARAMQLNTYQPTVYICLDLNAPLNCPLFLNIT